MIRTKASWSLNEILPMEFDEMKKAWHSQNNELLYDHNEDALHHRVLERKRQAYHITNATELFSIIVNFAVGSFILMISLSAKNNNIFMYSLAGWMFITALSVLVMRTQRMNRRALFDGSLQSDLREAISIYSYQLRLSLLIRWNILPIAALTFFGTWQAGKSIMLTIGMVIFLGLSNYASGWEYGLYKARKRELESLLEKLDHRRDDGAA